MCRNGVGNAESDSPGDVLIFGGRKEAGDFYYRAQWEEYVRDGTLKRVGGLLTAFSRDQEQKLYVTHRIRQHAADLWKLLQQVTCHPRPLLLIPFEMHCPSVISPIYL